MKEVNPREFVNSTEFYGSLGSERKKRLKGYLGGGLFISHSSLDYERPFSPGDEQNAFAQIENVAFDRFGPNGYFLHNLRSGGAESYRELVNIALAFCDKFLLVASARSVRSPWVRAELEFALTHQRPIIEAYLDDTDTVELYSILPAYLLHDHRAGRYNVNFHHDIKQGQVALANLLDQLLTQLPYPREQ